MLNTQLTMAFQFSQSDLQTRPPLFPRPTFEQPVFIPFYAATLDHNSFFVLLPFINHSLSQRNCFLSLYLSHRQTQKEATLHAVVRASKYLLIQASGLVRAPLSIQKLSFINISRVLADFVLTLSSLFKITAFERVKGKK